MEDLLSAGYLSNCFVIIDEASDLDHRVWPYLKRIIDAIKPDGDKCRVCGGELSARDDDQDETAIDKRHSIYYDTETGTLASSYYFKDLAAKDDSIKYFTLAGEKDL